MLEEVFYCFKARIPVLWMVTYEEYRAETGLASFTKALGKEKTAEGWVWSLTSGKDGMAGWERLRDAGNSSKCPFDDENAPHLALLSVINWAKKNQGQVSLVVFRDAHAYLDNATFCRALRDAARDLRGTYATIICISPIDNIPEDLKTDVAIVRPGLPDKKTLDKALKAVVERHKKNKIQFDDSYDRLVDACRGLTIQQAEDFVARSIVENKGNIDVEYISDKKATTLSSLPGLTYEGKEFDLSHVGGLEVLKEWAKKRKDTFSQEARDFGLPPPRGMLVVGVPGCGKSLTCKALASEYELPLLSLDLGAMKGGIVGVSERNIRNALDTAESLAPCVLLLDEVEKAVPSSATAALDSGVSADQLGTFLKWLNDKKGSVFCVMTANDISSLPPEFLRKGRNDEIFFVDLPNKTERKAIIEVHLRRINRELPEEDVEKLAKETGGEDWAYTGAEIEAAVNEGLTAAWYDEKRELTADDILTAAKAFVPLCKTMKENIQALREWAKNRARNASLPDITEEIDTTERNIIMEEFTLDN